MEHLKNLNEFNTNAHPEIHTNGSSIKNKGVNEFLGIMSFDVLSKYIMEFARKNPDMKNKLKKLIKKL